MKTLNDIGLIQMLDLYSAAQSTQALSTVSGEKVSILRDKFLYPNARCLILDKVSYCFERVCLFPLCFLRLTRANKENSIPKFKTPKHEW